jgi:hypothetical protein
MCYLHHVSIVSALAVSAAAPSLQHVYSSDFVYGSIQITTDVQL